MRAVHDEAAGRNRLQSGETLADPIPRGDGLEAQGAACGVGAGRQFAHRGLVRRRGKMNGDAPSALPVIHKADGNFIARKALGKQVGDAACRLFVGFEHGQHGLGRRGWRRIHWQI